MANYIIYTDLDGTLLDFKTYSFEEVADTVKSLLQKEIPIVFCSSKTRAEQEVFRQHLQVQHPFIVENGSAIFIPVGYFDFSISDYFPVKTKANYQVIELGVPAGQIRKIISEVREALHIDLKGYADLALTEIVALTGLGEDAARLASSREYSETILTGDTQSEKFEKFKQELDRLGLTCVSGGKFHTVMGKEGDKGKAVQMLNQLFAEKYTKISTIGLGDSANDEPLLRAVHYPFLVKKPGDFWQDIDFENLRKIDAIGPNGWNKAVKTLIPV